MGDIVAGFLIVLLLTFALFLFIAGLFTTYFGAGKSRKIGIVLSLLGVVVGIIGYLSYCGPFRPEKSGAFLDFIIEPVLYIIAAIVGAAIALLVFIGAIMKA